MYTTNFPCNCTGTGNVEEAIVINIKLYQQLGGILSFQNN